MTDAAVAGTVAHAPRLQHVHSAGCSLLTNAAVAHLGLLGLHLETATLRRSLTRQSWASCTHVQSSLLLRCLVSTKHQFANQSPRTECSRWPCCIVCYLLTDLSILELAPLPNIRRLSISSLPLVIDVSLLFLAEHGPNLVHLQLSHCQDVAA